MTEELKASDSAETPSAATPEKKYEEVVGKSSPAKSDSTSYIVDDTEKYLWQSFIITERRSREIKKSQESEK